MFGWLNDGFRAGLGIAVVGGAFGAAFATGGWTFGLTAKAHREDRRRRWWIQVLPVFALWLAFGLAATLSTLLD